MAIPRLLRGIISRHLARSPSQFPLASAHHRTFGATTARSHPSSASSFHTLPSRPRRSQVWHNNEPVPDLPPETDFAKMDVFASTPAPATSVDICLSDGFHLGGGNIHILGGSGAMLVGGEAFVWRPWEARQDETEEMKMKLVNEKGQWEVHPDAFGLLGLVWPRPDLLILGLGPEMRPLSPATRRHISNLGIRVEVLDTRNAASQFNLLATERGVNQVAAALMPIGWKEGKGAV